MKRYVAAALRALAQGNGTSQHETRAIHEKMPQRARAGFRERIKRMVVSRGAR